MKLKTLTLTLILLWSAAAPALAESGKNKSAGFLHAEGPNQQEIILPLKKTSARLEIQGGLIRAQVSQTFRNTSPYALEAVYVFPLPSQASVTDFTMVYKDKMVRSVVKERAEAEAIYEKAKSEGKKSALLEEERPNIFTTSVANLLPGESVEIRLNYLEAAFFSKGQYQILFPTVVGPRYIPLEQVKDEAGLKDALRITPPLLPEGVAPDHELEISASIEGIPIDKISSPTHDLEIQNLDAQSAEVKLAKKELPNRDFVMKIQVKAEGDKPLATLLQSKSKGQYYNLIHVYPPRLTAANAALPKDILFLVDTSGSMSGESILQAKKSLHACLDMLGAQDSFNIVRFSSDFSSFSPQSRAADAANLSAAHLFVGSLEANGGTEMQPALRYALQTPAVPGKMRIIVFLTDGDVGNEKSLIGLLQQSLGSTRLFSFGIGSAPNEYLLRKLGELGRGTSQFIHSGAEIDSTMTQFFATLNTPILTEVRIHWLDAQGREISGLPSYPKILPDLFADRPLQVVARSAKKLEGKMIVEGLLQGKPAQFQYELSTADKSREGIQTLWGRAEIDELLYDYNFPQGSSSVDALQKQIIEKALEYQLITPFTSRVAVEQKISRKPDGEIVSVGVPTLLPEGWDRAGLEGTASDEAIWFIVGAAWMGFGMLLWALNKAGLFRSAGRREC